MSKRLEKTREKTNGVDGDVREDISGQLGQDEDAADIAVAAVDELADRETELENLRAELADIQDRLLRQAAEYQNYRRRTEQEKAGLIEFGKGLVVQQILDVVDDFERSMVAAEQAGQSAHVGKSHQSLKEGVELVYRKLVDELARLGVEPIDAEGEPFDEHEHEAVMQQPAPEGTPVGMVLQEVQRGYRMGDRVLRHSKVVVSS